MRHLHDLHALREHYVVALAREVMLADADGNQFQAYRENPMRETLQSVEGLAADPGLYPAIWGISAAYGLWRRYRVRSLHRHA